ncbi:hypothetical protein LO772_21450 [Yinghuangia sp. ASG 101]|uniref:hypothetical protein n=1 Tax=Yinghuangia sp. ASG 101 TaxID=2896848 RepID=UPI001E4693E9|nr:hypothetical protein [Yinghuangia sp. ASG 101]UGQ09501.1 hypothetical protein LO772_21450 [Yinghuangia sp. ASG 101]
MRKAKRRTAALLGAVTIAGTAGLTALAPAAYAGTVTVDAACKVPIVGDKNGPQEIKVDFDVTEGPAGATVTASVDMGPPPITSPIAVNGAKSKSVIHLTMSGAATGQIDLASPETTLDIPANVPIDPDPFTTTFTIPATAADGAITFVPTSMDSTTTVPGFGDQVAPCTYTPQSGGDGAVASFTVKPLTPGEVTLSVTPHEVAKGGTVQLGGAGWPEGTPTVELCAAADCAADRFASQDAAVGADGKLTGSAVLADTVEPGAYTVKVTAGTGAEAKTKEAALTVAEEATPEPKVTVTPSSGKAGDKTTVAGTGFPADQDVEIAGVKADGSRTSDAAVTAKADAQGAFSADYPVGDQDTAAIRATSGDVSAQAAYTVKTDDTPPPSDPNGVEVTVPYSCTTVVEGFDIDVPVMTPTLGVTVLLPSSAAKGDTVDVQVAFKDQVISDIPSVAGDLQNGLHGMVTPTMNVVVSDGVNDPGIVPTTVAAFDVDMSPGGKMRGGPLTGTFEVPGGGTFSFTPGELVLVIDAAAGPITVTATSTCKPTGDVPVSATLTATGEPGGPPGQQNGGASGGSNGGSNGGTDGGGKANGGTDGGASGGDLAKTGSSASTLDAFALVAGTAVLAAVGVMLLLPRRRRARAGS